MPPKAACPTRTAVPNDVDLMLQRPTAAPPTVPVGAPETPRRWVRVLELVKPWPRLLPGIPPPAPLAMGWSTVTVEYHYIDQRTAHCDSVRMDVPVHVPLILSLCAKLRDGGCACHGAELAAQLLLLLACCSHRAEWWSGRTELGGQRPRLHPPTCVASSAWPRSVVRASHE